MRGASTTTNGARRTTRTTATASRGTLKFIRSPAASVPTNLLTYPRQAASARGILSIYAGLRKGELAGLEKGDVDLGRNLIHVRRSWSREFPKGDHEEAIPIDPELRPFLEQALQRAKGQLLFPRSKR